MGNGPSPLTHRPICLAQSAAIIPRPDEISGVGYAHFALGTVRYHTDGRGTGTKSKRDGKRKRSDGAEVTAQHLLATFHLFPFPGSSHQCGKSLSNGDHAVAISKIQSHNQRIAWLSGRSRHRVGVVRLELVSPPARARPLRKLTSRNQNWRLAGAYRVFARTDRTREGCIRRKCALGGQAGGRHRGRGFIYLLAEERMGRSTGNFATGPQGCRTGH